MLDLVFDYSSKVTNISPLSYVLLSVCSQVNKEKNANTLGEFLPLIFSQTLGPGTGLHLYNLDY